MRLATWRKAQKMTQGELAAQLGCSQPYVSQIERAKDPIVPGAAVMVEIFELTRGAVQPNDFFELPTLPDAQREAA